MTKADAAFFEHNRTFKLEQIEVVPPGPGEIQIDVAFCGICGTDLHIFHGAMANRLGDRRIIGHEASGRVAALGEGVNGFEVGQKVVVRPLASCGHCPACEAGHDHICHNLKFIGIDTSGGFQQKWTVPASSVHALPTSLSLEHAALIEPMAVACHDTARGNVSKDDYVLVIGGGPIGILVAIAARGRGGRVAISEVNPNRIEIARKLGFDTINPTQVDLKQTVLDVTGGKGADVVFEVSGSQAGVDAMTAAAAVRARIVMVAIHAQPAKVDLFQFFWRELDLYGARVYRPEDYEAAITMIAEGKVDMDTMITNRFALSDIQSAFEALESNPVAMKILIEIGGETGN